MVYKINQHNIDIMPILTVAKMPSVIELYIPRILGSVRKKKIVNTFHELNIGKIIYLDMHRKINENKNAYFFAFIKIELYHSFPAIELMSHLNEFKTMKITYDEETMQYWEVKTHIPQVERKNTDCVSESNAASNNKEYGLYDLWSGHPMLLSHHVYALNNKLLGVA